MELRVRRGRHTGRVDGVVEPEGRLHLPGVDSQGLAVPGVGREQVVGRTGQEVLGLVEVRHVRVGLTG